ncbi:hypothetical protein DSM112329_00876 [Paraconexibacter sp. AEG42_29]|uniref:SCP2 domain-containing protein n=1 Tax=Paraconexibacter sp. AEG42_29 TaxID=2997339 RepID=A0AAU7AQT2_9ACTN
MTEQPQPSTEMPPSDPQRVAEQTAEFFLQAAHDERLGDRLSLANTTVHIYFTDTVGVTLRLDSTPIQAEPRIVGNAEIELWGSADKFVSYARGERHLAMAIMHGEVEWTGPVRKFLRIMPILRSFDFTVWSHAPAA